MHNDSRSAKDRRVRVGNSILLLGGDILIAIDGNRIQEVGDLVQYLETKSKVGQVVELTIVREEKEQTTRAELGEQPREG